MDPTCKFGMWGTREGEWWRDSGECRESPELSVLSLGEEEPKSTGKSARATVKINVVGKAGRSRVVLWRRG